MVFLVVDSSIGDLAHHKISHLRPSRPLNRLLKHALVELRQWADAVLRRQYGGYELRDCWPNHIHAIWELSTLAAEWHQVYGGGRPDLAAPWSSTTAGS